ncbi:hypothetical protein KFE25_011818 [Diacronema lutheri]|uniref:3'-5' exonuclease domain-containing protein n=1 Tax=Diacronema lutheri TaxID=2081491 RepID=A0A8J6C305_DIALT|nr:hypothetical protein KFE25_011818 [Diacronema lutheri]
MMASCGAYRRCSVWCVSAVGASFLAAALYVRARRRARGIARPWLYVRGRPVWVISRASEPATADAALCAALCRLRAAAPVGLDAEWRPGSRSGVAVLQLASNAEVLVLHLAALRLSSHAHGALAAFLADGGVCKLGVGAATDGPRLRALGLPVGAHIDVVDDLAPQLALAPADAPRVGERSLASLSRRWLSVELDKAMQTSDWGARALSDAQLAYAALDALVSLEVAVAMHAAARARRAATLPFAAACAAVADAMVRAPASARDERGGGSGGAGGGTARCTKMAGGGHKVAPRQSGLYENCLILAPDGLRLSVCSAKKVRWYVQRGLADRVPHPDDDDDGGGGDGDVDARVAPADDRGARSAGAREPRVAIRLRFEPGGRGHADDRFYLEAKQNRCCVCAHADSFVRHAVVPHAYRQHFPARMKSHLSHDLVLLCTRCHARASQLTCEKVAAVARELGVPLEHEAAEKKLVHDAAALGARRSARALRDADGGGGADGGRRLERSKRARGKLPGKKRAELTAVLARFYGLRAPADVTSEHVDAACALDGTGINPRWVPHGRLVVERLGGEDGIAEFVRMWRRHFVETMHPRHLSPYWSVDARVVNSTAAVFGNARFTECAAAAFESQPRDSA